MTQKFVREKDLVERLVRRLRLDVESYADPNTGSNETGADVTILCANKRIGVQVTILDTGLVPGRAIAAEKTQSKAAMETNGGVYGGWGQPDPVGAIAVAIAKKSAIKVAGFDEAWLLVACGVPELGTVVSTFVMTPWLTAEALTIATSAALSNSSYARAFLHPIVNLEDALYEWTPTQQWRKDVRPGSEPSGPSFWDLQQAMARGIRHP